MKTLRNINRQAEEFDETDLSKLKIEPLKAFKLNKFIQHKQISIKNMFTRLGKVGYTFKLTLGSRTWKLYKRQKSFKNFHKDIEAAVQRDGRDYGLTKSVYCKDWGMTDSESMAEALKYHAEYLTQLTQDPDVVN